jgi:hypothetical protein
LYGKIASLLRTVEGDTENVNEVKEVFPSSLISCPAAQSVIGCIQIKNDLVIEETTH